MRLWFLILATGAWLGWDNHLGQIIQATLRVAVRIAT